MTLVNFVIIGLIVYMILKLHTMTIEITWMRRYMVRLLTEEVKGSMPTPPPPVEDLGLEEFDGDAIEEPVEDLTLRHPSVICATLEQVAPLVQQSNPTALDAGRIVEVTDDEVSVDLEVEDRSVKDDSDDESEGDTEEEVPPNQE